MRSFEISTSGHGIPRLCISPLSLWLLLVSRRSSFRAYVKSRFLFLFGSFLAKMTFFCDRVWRYTCCEYEGDDICDDIRIV